MFNKIVPVLQESRRSLREEFETEIIGATANLTTLHQIRSFIGVLEYGCLSRRSITIEDAENVILFRSYERGVEDMLLKYYIEIDKERPLSSFEISKVKEISPTRFRELFSLYNIEN